MTARVTLDDKYVVDNGNVFLSGVQALVRLPISQRRRDRAAGLNTAGFVSGYRGSPLAGYDKALWDAAGHLAAHDVVVQPAVNEEMAATAIIGTQQLILQPEARHDGVFAVWYGKGPGLDRAGDALKHGNSLGSAPRGGVLVVAGDDHGAVSSSMAHQSEQLMASWLMPVLNPASVAEYVELGLYGIAMSRFSGCWTGFKAVAETVESSAVWRAGDDAPRIALPDDVVPPAGGLNFRWPDSQLAQEERLHRHKLPAAVAFARANRLDRIVVDARGARLGIVATGKAWADLRQALADLEIEPAAFGLRLYKVALSWPLEPEGALAFGRGLDKVLVVEEKRGIIEPQLKELFYHLPADRRPAVFGKSDPAGRPLLPSHGELGADTVARALAEFLDLSNHPPARERLALLAEKRPAAGAPPRLPWFCPGCPHNVSTKLPEGCRAYAGTGCHLMSVWMDRSTASLIHMGGEGVNWVGQAPFTERPHMFQNLGDGTYVHSGVLAIRQAVAAKTNITYKILFNDAVAMTGGQPFEAPLTVARLTQQLHHEGVGRIAVVSDHPADVDKAGLAPGVTVHDRAALDAVQRDLAGWKGVSAIVYRQECATAKRRRLRRAGAQPARRVVIHPAVCDNCGDCVRKSNCLALTPVETPLGLRRAINQSACNSDMSCVDALCPAFVTIDGSLRRRAPQAPPAELPPPAAAAPARPWNILITGIGGTGVVTVGQILGYAAQAEGQTVSVLDFAGLSQKGGGVLSHVRIGGEPHSPRIGTAAADLVLAGDLVVAGGAEVQAKMRRGRTRLLGNADVTPTAAMVRDPDTAPPAAEVRRAAGDGELIAASAFAEALLGDALYANMLLLGYAWQKGLVPVGAEALDQAIRLNGIAVAENRAAFAWGRLAAVDVEAVRRAAGLGAPVAEADLGAYLAAYQDEALAARHRAMTERAAALDLRLWGGRRQEFSRAVASGYFRVLAWKDEYEVARQLSDPAFLADLADRFEPGWRPRFHMVVPFGGGERKTGFGSWILPALRLLARCRSLRGTALDPFRRLPERSAERAFRTEYEAALETAMAAADHDSYAVAVALAALPEGVRGYGSVKMAALDKARAQCRRLVESLQPDGRRQAAE